MAKRWEYRAFLVWGRNSGRPEYDTSQGKLCALRGFYMLIFWKDLWNLTRDPQEAPDEPQHFTLFFEKGIPTKLIVGEEAITDSLALFKRLNLIGFENGERLKNYDKRDSTVVWLKISYRSSISAIEADGLIVTCPRTVSTPHILQSRLRPTA